MMKNSVFFVGLAENAPHFDPCEKSLVQHDERRILQRANELTRALGARRQAVRAASAGGSRVDQDGELEKVALGLSARRPSLLRRPDRKSASCALGSRPNCHIGRPEPRGLAKDASKAGAWRAFGDTGFSLDSGGGLACLVLNRVVGGYGCMGKQGRAEERR